MQKKDIVNIVNNSETMTVEFVGDTVTLQTVNVNHALCFINNIPLFVYSVTLFDEFLSVFIKQTGFVRINIPYENIQNFEVE